MTQSPGQSSESMTGCVVTLDALGFQKAVVKKIVDNGGDYVLTLRVNQSLLNEDVQMHLEDVHQEGFTDTPQTFCETTNYGYGRTKTRGCWVVTQIDWLAECHPEWEMLSVTVLVEIVRSEGHTTCTGHRLYVSSLTTDVKHMTSVVRGKLG